MPLAVDLNCDLGEGSGRDAELMPLVTSANIACGAHAGDEQTMRDAVLAAKRSGAAIGAHPGFADREHFGRRELSLPASEIVALVRSQVEALRRVAADAGARVTHVKPHGALYNLAARDAVTADAVAAAVASVDDRLWLYGLAGGKLLDAGRARGLRVASEVFADRTYQPDGSLTPRTRPDAFLHDAAASVAQVFRMIRDRKVRAVDGSDVLIEADTICLHGDGAEAVVFARALRGALAESGVRLRPLLNATA